MSNDKSFVVTKSRVLLTDEVVEIAGDLLVAADGCLSSIRRHFLPNFKLRYVKQTIDFPTVGHVACRIVFLVFASTSELHYLLTIK